jgi:hypothetical protein
MESAPGPETVIDGVRYLYFGGTSYLGLANHPEVIAAGCEALRRYGVHSATTRARFGTNPPVLGVERQAAEFFGTGDAFYFHSGYVANHILVAALAPAISCASWRRSRASWSWLTESIPPPAALHRSANISTCCDPVNTPPCCSTTRMASGCSVNAAADCSTN